MYSSRWSGDFFAMRRKLCALAMICFAVLTTGLFLYRGRFRGFALGSDRHYSPHTGRYLEPAAGLPNRQLIAMGRRGLRLDLRNAMREATQSRRPAKRERVSFEFDEKSVQLVNILVDPLGNSERDPLFLVVFQDVGSPITLSELAPKGTQRPIPDESTVRRKLACAPQVSPVVSTELN